MGKNNIICPNSATNKRIVVIITSKMRDEVCVYVSIARRTSYVPASRMLEFSRESVRETFSNGLFSGSSFEPSGRLLPLRYQVERIVSSIPGSVLPVILRVRFCVAVNGSTARFPRKFIWVPRVLLGAACMRKLQNFFFPYGFLWLPSHSL